MHSGGTSVCGGYGRRGGRRAAGAAVVAGTASATGVAGEAIHVSVVCIGAAEQA